MKPKQSKQFNFSLLAIVSNKTLGRFQAFVACNGIINDALCQPDIIPIVALIRVALLLAENFKNMLTQSITNSASDLPEMKHQDTKPG